MSKLTAKQRKGMPSSEFGDPAARKFPMPDKAHAANAKARASQAADKGLISKNMEAQIDAKANAKLGKK
jgi:hypothetical protein